jgi:hypothetical protein
MQNERILPLKRNSSQRTRERARKSSYLAYLPNEVGHEYARGIDIANEGYLWACEADARLKSGGGDGVSRIFSEGLTVDH